MKEPPVLFMTKMSEAKNYHNLVHRLHQSSRIFRHTPYTEEDNDHLHISNQYHILAIKKGYIYCYYQQIKLILDFVTSHAKIKSVRNINNVNERYICNLRIFGHREEMN